MVLALGNGLSYLGDKGGLVVLGPRLGILTEGVLPHVVVEGKLVQQHHDGGLEIGQVVGADRQGDQQLASPHQMLALVTGPCLALVGLEASFPEKLVDVLLQLLGAFVGDLDLGLLRRVGDVQVLELIFELELSQDLLHILLLKAQGVVVLVRRSPSLGKSQRHDTHRQ